LRLHFCFSFRFGGIVPSCAVPGLLLHCSWARDKRRGVWGICFWMYAGNL